MSPEVEEAEQALCEAAWQQYLLNYGPKPPGHGAREAFRAAWFMYAQHRMAHMPAASALPVAELEMMPTGPEWHFTSRMITLDYGRYALYAARTTR